MGQEENEQQKKFEEIRTQIDDAHKDLNEEEKAKTNFLSQIDSLNIVIPAIEKICLETTAAPIKELKICELPVLKHYEYEKLISQMDVKAGEDVDKLKEMKLEDFFEMKMTDWEQMKAVVITICDNGLNLDKDKRQIVDEEFCDKYLTWSLAASIILTYNKKFVGPNFMQLWTLKNFFQRVLLFFGRQNE